MVDVTASDGFSSAEYLQDEFCLRYPASFFALSCIPIIGIFSSLVLDDKLDSKLYATKPKDSHRIVQLIHQKNLFKIADVVRNVVTGILTGILVFLFFYLAWRYNNDRSNNKKIIYEIQRTGTVPPDYLNKIR